MPQWQDRQASDPQTFSKAIFGNSIRLDLLAAIAREDGPFTPREIASVLDVADNLVTTQLARLSDLGLLTRTRRDRGGVAYERTPSVLWPFVTELRDELAEAPPAPAPPPKRPTWAPAFVVDDPGLAAHLVAEALPAAEAHLDRSAFDAFQRLAKAALRMLIGGQPASGLSAPLLGQLSGVSRGYLDTHVNERWPIAAEAIIRAMPVPVAFEELVAVPVPVGRQNEGFGVDSRAGIGRSLHMLTTLLVGDSAPRVAAAIRLAAGTRDDPSDGRAIQTRVQRWGSEPRWLAPLTLTDAIASMLATSQEVTARTVGVPALRPLVMHSLHYGPPQHRGASSGVTTHPGAVPEIVDAVLRSGRPGLLYAGPVPGVRTIADPDLTPIAPGHRASRDEPDAAYMWSQRSHRLIRLSTLRPHDADAWQYVGDARDPTNIVALLERALASPRKTSAQQWAEATQPGLIRARSLRVWSGILAVVNVAHAALAASRSPTASR